MSKPKSNSIIESLPENQRAQIESWLFEENLSYKDCSARCWQDFSVRCGPNVFGSFYQRVKQRRMLEHIATSRGMANAAVEKFKANPADMYQVLLDMAGQIAFDQAFQSEQKLDAETIYNFTKLVMAGKKQAMAAQKLSLDERRVKLLEKKAAAFDRAQEIMKSAGGITPETFKKIEAELKLL